MGRARCRRLLLEPQPGVLVSLLQSAFARGDWRLSVCSPMPVKAGRFLLSSYRLLPGMSLDACSRWAL